MFKSKKESSVRDLVDDHLSRTEKCLEAAQSVFVAYLAGDLLAADENATKVEKYERAADKLRREIYALLGEGAFLPIMRADIHALVGDLDDLAGLAEDFSDAIVGERPEIPPAYREVLVEIFDKTTHQFSELKAGIHQFFFAKRIDEKETRKIIHRVAQAEYEIDQIEWDLTRQIFDSNLPLANKLHLKHFLGQLTIISNKVEDVSDTLSELMVKLQA